MPAPTNERQALERERAELPTHLANYQRELDATPQENWRLIAVEGEATYVARSAS